MFTQKQRIEQSSFWVATHELATPKILSFYRALDAILMEIGFGPKVREWCARYFKIYGPGYPGVDPEEYFKILMVGVFEGIRSERGIDERCPDSHGIGELLGYGISVAPPFYATLGNIRWRLGEEVFEKAFGFFQEKRAEESLLQDNHLGIDTSVREAEASLRLQRNKKSGKKYRADVRALVAQCCVDTETEFAVNRCDRKRKDKKLSNDDSAPPNDRDERTGREKKGATTMHYKVEHIVDLDMNALIGMHIIPGDEGDSKHPTDHFLASKMRVAGAIDPEEMNLHIETVIEDMGDHSTREVHNMYEAYSIIPNIPDPTLNRKIKKLSKE